MDLPPETGPAPSDGRAPSPSSFGERTPETILRIGFVVAFLWIARPLAIPVILGGIAAVVIWPLHAWLRARSRRWAKVSPGLLTAGALVGVAGPATGIFWKAISSANEIVSGTSVTDVSAYGEKLLRRLGRSIGADAATLEMMRAAANDAAVRVSRGVASGVASVLASIPEYITGLFLMTLALYFGLRDGDRFVRFLRRISPADPADSNELLYGMQRAILGAVLGMVVIAIVQGGICLVALLALRVPGAVLWGVLAALFSVLPVIGTTPVTMGATVYLVIADRPVAAGIMFATALFIGGIDNVIRPWVQGSHDRVHPFVELLAIFGGIAVLGLSGLFIGPALAAMALWAIQSWKRRTAIAVVS